jgi:2-polyprenyl-6-methoxyphenol hydroxylase-like FAD-dependent oxidoreductase
MLAHLMRLAGVDTVVLESRTRDYCENRVRAGLLEQGSVDLMDEIGASDRLHREALVHVGIHVRYDGRSHRVSGKDLIALHLAAGGDVRRGGFALFTMRSSSMSRLSLQVAADDDINAWSDDRAWTELHHRLEGESVPPLVEGPVLQKTVLPMRSFVAAPMRFRRLFLAGEAA